MKIQRDEMQDIGVVTWFLNKIEKLGDFLESNQKRAVVRALRVLYFFPDQSLADLEKIIQSNGTDISPLINIKRRFDASEAEVKKEIEFLTSDAVVTNLKIPFSVVTALREVAYTKSGVRALLVSAFFNREFRRAGEALEAARSAKSIIIDLNKKLATVVDKLEERPH